MKYYLTIFIVILLSTLLNSSNLSWIHPLPQGNTLYSTFDLNGTIFAVGEYGTIMKSTDAGENWDFENKICGIKSHLKDIDFHNSNFGLIVGEEGTVLRTENGGNSWNYIDSGITVDINCVEIVNQTLIYIGTSQGLYKSTDSGNSWEYCCFTGNLKSIDFPSEQIGYLCAYATVYKTIDGGENWVLNYTLTFEEVNHIHDLCFFDTENGIFVGEFIIDPYNMPEDFGIAYRTYDGGASWEATISWCLPLISISYKENYVYACGNLGIYGNVIKSDDYGENWIEMCVYPNVPKSVALLDDAAITVGKDGIMLKQEIDETTWNVIGEHFHSNLVDVQFVNDDIGYISSIDDNIFKSEDSGNTWVLVDSDTSIDKFFFINENLGYGINADEIYKTINGGTNWQLSYYLEDDHYLDIFFINFETGFVGGLSGIDNFILKTEDGGENWERIIVNEIYYIREMLFVNENIGFLSDDNYILKTFNGGYNWSICYITTNIWSLWNIQFPSENIGYCCGHLSLLKTEDGGDTWFSLDSPLYWQTGVFFISDEVGFVTGSGNEFIKTEDGGNSWEIFDYLYSSLGTYTKSFFFDEDHGIIVGRHCILKYDDETGVSESIIKLNDFQLYNYPNPFNPETTISYTLPINIKNPVIEIYNIKGQKVRTFNCNTELVEGSIIWDGTDENNQSVSSGIYFYQLNINGKTKALGKMLLMK
jgi:photosystem II stability/assembly factor-like uncharacterized protein